MKIVFISWSICVWITLASIAILSVSKVCSRRCMVRVAVVFASLSLLLGVVNVFVSRSTETLGIDVVFRKPAEARLILSLSSMTSVFTSEGHNGGLLMPPNIDDAYPIIPNLTNVVNVAGIVWAHEFEPVSYKIAGRTIRVMGVKTNAEQIAIFAIPSKRISFANRIDFEELSEER